MAAGGQPELQTLFGAVGSPLRQKGPWGRSRLNFHVFLPPLPAPHDLHLHSPSFDAEDARGYFTGKRPAGATLILYLPRAARLLFPPNGAHETGTCLRLGRPAPPPPLRASGIAARPHPQRLGPGDRRAPKGARKPFCGGRGSQAGEGC